LGSGCRGGLERCACCNNVIDNDKPAAGRQTTPYPKSVGLGKPLLARGANLAVAVHSGEQWYISSRRDEAGQTPR
jgi:hypothetical protein